MENRRKTWFWMRRAICMDRRWAEIPGVGLDVGFVYKFDAAGKFTILHKFNGSDGYGPGFLNLDETNGTLYGATGLGGAYNWGTIFEFALNQ